jgi:hypothetical protein
MTPRVRGEAGARRAPCWPVLLLGLFVLGCSGLSTTPGGSPAPCEPSFEDRSGWLGGDAAWSIPLATRAWDEGPEGVTRSVWLFGDSFVAAGADAEAGPGSDPGAGKRRHYPFVHNTVGLSRCDPDGRWSIELFWDREDPDAPGAWFAPEPAPAADPMPAHVGERSSSDGAALFYYWPFGGFLHDGALFVALLRIVPAPPRGPFALPFRIAGVDLARIMPATARPDRWNVELTRLAGPSALVPAAAFVVHGGFVHAFAFFDREAGEHPRALIRLPLEALDAWPPDLSGSLQTLDAHGAWQPGLQPEAAAILIPDDATEMSVHWDAVRQRWLAVESSATRAGAEHAGVVRLRRAERLEGPWSEAQTLFVMPELRAASIDPNVFCYAAKAHPQYATPSTLLLTYVCSLYAPTPDRIPQTLQRLTERTDLYRPVAVRVPIPSPPVEAGSAAGDETGPPES